jgi:hypothetical protein
MFSHIMIGAHDMSASKKFCDAIMGALGIPPGKIDDKGRVFYMTKTGIFGITIPINGEPACAANGGMACEDPPGICEGGSMKLYIAHLPDPAGNKICAVKRMS